MSDEVFDVVNERDEVVGRATRQQVHARGWMHRAVHVLVFNREGKVFLQKRSMTKDTSPGLWDSSASGHVDSGESYDACAVRELKEELGLTLSQPLQRVVKLAACSETGEEHVRVYQCNAEGPFDVNPDEIERGEWVSVARVTERIAARPEAFSPAFRFIWQRLSL